MAKLALLHERWFVPDDERFRVQFELAGSSQTLIPLGIAMAVTGGALLLWRWRSHRDLVPGPVRLGMSWENYERVLSWMPLVLGLHTAALLLASGVSRHFLVPNLPLSFNFLGGLLGLTQIAIGLSFFYGALTRWGAVLLALLWLTGVFIQGPAPLLEHTLFLGIAFFLFAGGRGSIAFDGALGIHKPSPSLVRWAVPALRICTGLSIAVLAFTEKLWNLPLALEFFKTHHFNFMPSLGFEGIGDTEFALIAGTIELTFGLLLISGAFPRLMILVLWLPFNLTLPFLGWKELVGHLPIYGIMALLLIWGEQKPEKEAAFVEGIRRSAAAA